MKIICCIFDLGCIGFNSFIWFCKRRLYFTSGIAEISNGRSEESTTGIILIKLIAPYFPHAILRKSILFFMAKCFGLGDESGA